MRVLHVFHHIYHYHCGYRTRSEFILRFQQTHGIDPVVVTSSDHEHGAVIRDAKGPYVLRRTPAYYGPEVVGIREWRLIHRLQRQIEAAIEELQPDVVHAHSPMLVALPAFWTSRRFKLPFVYEVRDLWENAAVDLGKFTSNSWRYRLARGVDTYLLRRADAVVVLGEEMRRELQRRGVSTARLHIVGNGVDAGTLGAAGADRYSARTRWNLGDDPTIGYVGTFQPYEGLDLLFEALPAIRAVYPVRVLIAGDGRDAERLRQRVAALGMESFVTFTGRLPHGEVGQVYAAADVMVYPRLLTRTTALTTPLKPLEAMALGTPVLASNVGGLGELVRDGETGSLFDAGDANHLATECLRLIADPSLRQRMADSARAWVMSSRQWVDQVARYNPVYETVLNSAENRVCA